jgi:hypothetical protein
MRNACASYCQHPKQPSLAVPFVIALSFQRSRARPPSGAPRGFTANCQQASAAQSLTVILQLRSNFIRTVHGLGERVLGWGTMLQAGWSRFLFPMRSLDFFDLPNSSSRIMALGSTQLLTEISTRNLHGGKGRPGRTADNLTVICEPIFWKLWEPRRLTTLCTSTACYRDIFTFLPVHGYCIMLVRVSWVPG